MEPGLIACDEPVSSLDVSVRAHILTLRHNLQQRLGLAYLYISRDLASVRGISHRVATMCLGVRTRRNHPRRWIAALTERV